MKWAILLLSVAIICWGMLSCATTALTAKKPGPIAMAQIPTWSQDDLDFFIHGSMSTEFVPERVLNSFILTYPELFPKRDLSNLGLMPDGAFGWPIGFSRSNPEHLAGLSSVGVNCAACHVTELRSSPTSPPVRILGTTRHFDAEAFFGAVIAATYKTQDPNNMFRFLNFYIALGMPLDPPPRQDDVIQLASSVADQFPKMASAMATDPGGSHGAGPGGLQKLDPTDFNTTSGNIRDIDFLKLSVSMLKLFHNMRAALHVPDVPPKELPPPSGPGRNDAFGLLSAVLFNAPQPISPVKYGIVWNVDRRPCVHWDGNTLSPIGRNLLASLGLGAPLIGHHAQLDFAMVKRQTDLTEHILPPKYPFPIDLEAAKRGGPLYASSCASCHDGAEDDHRLYDVGTDPRRAKLFTPTQAERFSGFLMSIETPGYVPSSKPGIRSTQKYWSPSLAGVWARSPYLHNGSVRTMQELLTSPASRATSFHRGSNIFDANQMGFLDEGNYLLDAKSEPNSNAGHDFGTNLTDQQKRDLIEYLKTL